MIIEREREKPTQKSPSPFPQIQSNQGRKRATGSVLKISRKDRWARLLSRRVIPSSMAFWGATVQEGGPPLHVSLDCTPYRRLRISKAVMGRKKHPCDRHAVHYLFCKVGDNPEVCVSSLKFEVREVDRLDLEFIAPDDIVFHVRGYRDIYLSGYYFDEYPPPPTIVPQMPVVNEEQEASSRQRPALESPSPIDPQVAGPSNHMPDTLACIEEIATSSGLNVDKNANLEKVALISLGDVGEKSKNIDESSRSSIDARRKVVLEPSLSQFVITGALQRALASSHAKAEATEKYHGVDVQKLEAIIEGIGERDEVIYEAESLSHNDSEMIGCVQFKRKLESFDKDVVTEVSQWLLDSRASSSRQPSIAVDNQSPMQNLAEILARLFCGIITKTPWMMNWSSINMFWKRLIDLESSLGHHPWRNGHAKRDVISRLPERSAVDNEVNLSKSLVEEKQSPRHAVKITLLESEQEKPRNIVDKPETISTKQEEESIRPLEEVNDTDHLRGHSERHIDEENNKCQRKKATSLGKFVCKENIDFVQHESVSMVKAMDWDKSHLVEEERMKPEKRKKKKIKQNSECSNLTIIGEDASEPLRRNDAAEPQKGIYCDVYQLVKEETVKPSRKKKKTHSRSACSDLTSIVEETLKPIQQIDAVEPQKGVDGDEHQLVDEQRLKPGRKKKKTKRSLECSALTSISDEASESVQPTIQPTHIIQSRKGVDWDESDPVDEEMLKPEKKKNIKRRFEFSELTTISKEASQPFQSIDNFKSQKAIDGNESDLVAEETLKPERKKKKNQSNIVGKTVEPIQQSDVVKPKKGIDGDESQFVDEENLKIEREKKKIKRSSVCFGLTSIKEEASDPIQKIDNVEPQKGIDCLVDEEGQMQERKRKKSKRSSMCSDLASISDSGMEPIQHTNSVELQKGVDLGVSQLVNEERPKLKKKKKTRKNSASSLASIAEEVSKRDQQHDFAPEKGIGRTSHDIDEEMLEMPSSILKPRDGVNTQAINKEKKKAKQVIRPVVDTAEKNSRCVAAESAARQVTSASLENNKWTILAALPACPNSKTKGIPVECKGESKQKKNKQLSTQAVPQMEMSVIDNEVENSRSDSVESGTLDYVIKKIVSSLPDEVHSKVKHGLEEPLEVPDSCDSREIKKRKKKKVKKVKKNTEEVSDLGSAL